MYSQAARSNNIVVKHLLYITIILKHIGVDFFQKKGDGGEIETPKASRGKGMGSGCLPPQPRVWGAS